MPKKSVSSVDYELHLGVLVKESSKCWQLSPIGFLLLRLKLLSAKQPTLLNLKIVK